MQISDDDLRALVRDAIARHTTPGGRSADGPPPAGTGALHPAHPSHRVFSLDRGSDGDGACLIEPAVRCNHCQFCQSYGH